SIIRIAASMSRVFRSASFTSAISRIWLRVTFPSFFLFGSPEPFSMPAAFLRSTDAGGVFVTKVNVRSAKTVISTGTIVPTCLAVLSLYVLQNSMMLTPCWPRAGPTGGAGVAFPAGICSLTMATTFFMTPPRASDLFDLREVQFHRSLPAEDRHQHPHLLLLGQNLVDETAEVHERTGVDPNRGALLVGNPELRGLIAHLSQNGLDLAILEGQRLAAGPHKAGNPRRVSDDVPG